MLFVDSSFRQHTSQEKSFDFSRYLTIFSTNKQTPPPPHSFTFMCGCPWLHHTDTHLPACLLACLTAKQSISDRDTCATATDAATATTRTPLFPPDFYHHQAGERGGTGRRYKGEDLAPTVDHLTSAAHSITHHPSKTIISSSNFLFLQASHD